MGPNGYDHARQPRTWSNWSWHTCGHWPAQFAQPRNPGHLRVQGGYGTHPPCAALGGQGPYPPQSLNIHLQQEYASPSNYESDEPSSDEEANGTVDERQLFSLAIFGVIPGAPAPMPGARRVGANARSTITATRQTSRTFTRRTSSRTDHHHVQQQIPAAQASMDQAPPSQQQRAKVNNDLLNVSFGAPAAPHGPVASQQSLPPLEHHQPQIMAPQQEKQPIKNSDPFRMGPPLPLARVPEGISPAASIDPATG